METGLTKNQLIEQLARSSHGDLTAYVPIARAGAAQEPEFLAHLIAWNQRKGQIRDSRVALPVASLVPGFPLWENSLAHLALLDPRNLVRALDLARAAKTDGYSRKLRGLVEKYLRVREGDRRRWTGAVLQHRASMKRLYALFHVKPAAFANAVLFKDERPAGSPFEAVANLKTMGPAEAAEAMRKHRLPFLVVVGGLGPRAKDEGVVLEMIRAMSPSELVTNVKTLQRLGVKDSPVLRAAYDEGLKRVSETKTGALKTTRAADALAASGDEQTAERLRGVQERQLDAMSIEGDWLVLGDRSPSMKSAIEASRYIAATLARMAKGTVTLIFFDGGLHKRIDATGKSYDELLALTKGITAGGGGTSIGAGMQWAAEAKVNVDGIAIATDGGENTPPVSSIAYEALSKRLDKAPPVYAYLLDGESRDTFTGNMKARGHDVQVFDLRGKPVDYHSIPNLVQTMRTNRYSLVDEIMNSRLLSLEEALAA